MKRLRGWFGEKKTAFSMWLSLDTGVYRRFHNVIVPSSNGTTQIDHVLVSPFGIFIVETKNFNGWIFGSADQAKWTQLLYGKKYGFQNPLWQAYRQKKVLSEFLGIDESLIHTIICFVGNCKFKTELPANVIRSGPGRYIKQFQVTVIGPEVVLHLGRTLENHVAESTLTRNI